MPALSNHRHEKFAQALAQGKNATEAHQEAGYKPSHIRVYRRLGTAVFIIGMIWLMVQYPQFRKGVGAVLGVGLVLMVLVWFFSMAARGQGLPPMPPNCEQAWEGQCLIPVKKGDKQP